MPRIKYNISIVNSIAKSRGGKCLSHSCKLATDRLIFECAYGHTWETKICTIAKGCWCPTCSVGIRERLLATFLEQKLLCNFKKVRPPWLKSKSGACLELDFFNEKEKLAIEHNGAQHLKKISKFKMNHDILNRIIDNDLIKIDKCKEMGIDLIIVPQLIEIVPLSVLSSFIKNKLIELGKENIMKIDYDNISVDYFTAYSNNYCMSEYKKLQDIAKDKGGELLSNSYNGSEMKLKWKCLNGHVWETTPAHIKKGCWCRKCHINKRKGNLDEAKMLANQRGGKCISDIYINSNTKLLFLCKCGYKWAARIDSIRKGSWCPKCAGNVVTFDDIKLAGKNSGLECVSTEYSGKNTNKLLWKCKNGHIFERSYISVKRGHCTCKICAISDRN